MACLSSFGGDTGGNNPANMSESGVAYEGAKVADAISYYATEVNPDFMVLLGDNFHPRGVQNTTDPVSPLKSSMETHVGTLGVT